MIDRLNRRLTEDEVVAIDGIAYIFSELATESHRVNKYFNKKSEKNLMKYQPYGQHRYKNMLQSYNCAFEDALQFRKKPTWIRYFLG